MTTKQTILVVDDEETIRKLLRARFEREQFQVISAENVDDALLQLKTHPEIAVVVTDIKMPGRSGVELLKEIKSKTRSPKVIVMTGHGEKSTAIEALRLGASEYLEKPFEMEEMTHSVKRTFNEFKMERENEDFVSRLEARVARVEGKEADQFWFVSKAKAMEPVNEWLKVLQRESMRALTQDNVEEPSTLITGESGTGKEGIARMIHAGSKRAKGPWIAINCANFNDQLLESELFGHEKGSFTGATAQKRGLFELAKGGTLFLDEIGEMDIKLQARILRVLQEKTFRRVGGSEDIKADIRFVAATNQNLSRYIAEGKFREDLFHRISRVVVELPPLRARFEDIVPMSELFFERAFSQRGKKFDGLTAEAKASISKYSWPGNIRELLNVIERTALLWSKVGVVEASDIILPETTSHSAAHKVTNSTFQDNYRPGITLNPDTFKTQNTFDQTQNYTQLKKKWSDEFEREYLQNILARVNGNVTAAAKESGIDRSNFLRLMRRHQLHSDSFRALKKAA